jgi:5-methyltetrahydrofolate--homocysteine methyltransferase
MVNLAREMERQGFELPLLIGGATTSRAHTAVKVAPQYEGPVVWVKDASRSVPVVSALLSAEQRPGLVADVGREYEALRQRHAGRQRQDRLIPLSTARANRTVVDWSDYRPQRPATLGVSVFRDYPLAELRRYIDWQPFFIAWEMKGRYPQILNSPTKGEAARRLWDDAQAMLDQAIEEGWIRAHGVAGLFPANQVDGEDIAVYEDNGDETRTAEAARLHHLRQQTQHEAGVPNRSLADFVAPRSDAGGVADYVGAFAVTAGMGSSEKVAEFKKANDDYNAILLESLADRLAEAFAERLHERVRKVLWGYAPGERLDIDELVKEHYRGIRPAPGYPACPDHTEKATLWRLLDVEGSTGIVLTESYAMWPGASVSGWYFAHPDSRYFSVGRINRDQAADYARRKGWDLKQAEKWLAPNLGYEPED